MAQTFFPITPTEITASGANSWVDMDASGSVPAGATGVILHCVNNHATGDYYLGLRKNGSTDNRTQKLYDNRHNWVMIGVDANRVFEAYVGSTTGIDIHIVGYTKSGVTFKTNADNKSLGTIDSWLDIDCSSEAPSAIGIIFEITVDSANREFGLRKNGSSDDRHKGTNYHGCFGAVIGCDASQICEGYIVHTVIDFFLVGYITDGCTFNTNATDVSLSTTGSWIDLPALPSGANMGFIEAYSTYYQYGLRKNGSSEDIFRKIYKHIWAIVECDSSQIIEGKIDNVATDFFVVGYSTAEEGPTEKSSSDTGSGAEASSEAATLSKADSGGGVEALLSRVLGVAEVGSGTEAWALLAALVGTGETGEGAEFASKLFSSADSGSGVESLLTRLLATSEIGTGTETLLSRLLHHTDSGLGADTCLTLLATLTRAQTGSGVDAYVEVVVIGQELSSSDVGAGIDALAAFNIALAQSDAGSGLDAGALCKTFLSTDSGVGLEALAALNIALAQSDAGSGLDAATLYEAFLSTDSGVGLEALTTLLALITTSEIGLGSEQLRAKIMTSAGAYDMKLPTKMGKAEIPSKGVNL